MKKAITIILFVLAIVALIFSVCVAVCGAVGIYTALKEMSNTTGVSGIDYSTVDFSFVVCSFVAIAAAFAGLILSGIAAAISDAGLLKKCSSTMCFLFVFVMLSAPIFMAACK